MGLKLEETKKEGDMDLGTINTLSIFKIRGGLHRYMHFSKVNKLKDVPFKDHFNIDHVTDL